MNNLKAYQKRECDWDEYYIPIELIEEFDNLVQEIDGSHSDRTYLIWQEIEDKFSKYKVEGEINGIVIWINPDDLKSVTND